jgi:hypothetical protein
MIIFNREAGSSFRPVVFDDYALLDADQIVD